MSEKDATGDDDLRILLQRVARRIRTERAGDNISDTQLGVLFVLEKSGPTTPGRLAEHERVSPPSMNRTLNGLEGAGLVRRDPAPDDARKVLVTITDGGHELIVETRRLRTAWFTRQLAELSDDERRLLASVAPVLQKLADA